MKYNPDKHRRQSIRLKGYNYTLPGIYFITICTYQRECLFGEIVDGEMQLNDMGKVVRSHWLKLPSHHSHLRLDTFIIMPNHLHGILELTNHHGVGAGLADQLSIKTINLSTKPAHPSPPLPPKFRSLTEIIRGFKTFSARHINRMRKASGVPVWQRNYYEHIIRNEEALQNIQIYIENNPQSWQQDQLHPNNPSKW